MDDVYCCARRDRLTCCPVSRQSLQNLPRVMWDLNTKLVLSEHHTTSWNSSTTLQLSVESIKPPGRGVVLAELEMALPPLEIAYKHLKTR
jgi:hypothetical protein